MISKILIGLTAFGSFVIAIFSAGVFWKKSDNLKGKLKGKDAAIEAAKEAEREANEAIENAKPDIVKRRYFSMFNKK